MVKKKAKKKVVKKGEFIPKNRFIFVGNGEADPAYISMMGYMFKLNGRGVEVSDTVAAKLRGNNHFKEG